MAVQAYAWGDNSYGLLGQGLSFSSQNQITAPNNAVNVISEVSHIATGWNHSLAIANGQVWAWGRNQFGQLGNPFISTVSDTPVAVECPAMSAIAAGDSFSLALDSTGTVWAWGSDSTGQLGDGNHTVVPVKPKNMFSGATAIAAGSLHGLAAMSDGSVRAWGQNKSGQLGVPLNILATGPTNPTVQVTQSSGMSGVVAVAAGSYFSLALDSTGAVWAWGANTSGQLGDPQLGDPNVTLLPPSPVPVKVSLQLPPGVFITGIAAGSDHGLALDSKGNLWTWGSDQWGQLGDGVSGIQYNRSNPEQVTPQGTSVRGTDCSIAGGTGHSLVICSNGTIFACGWNQHGQLGNGSGSTDSQGQWVEVQSVNIMVPLKIAAAGYHSLAILASSPYAPTNLRIVS